MIARTLCLIQVNCQIGEEVLVVCKLQGVGALWETQWIIYEASTEGLANQSKLRVTMLSFVQVLIFNQLGSDSNLFWVMIFYCKWKIYSTTKTASILGNAH